MSEVLSANFLRDEMDGAREQFRKAANNNIEMQVLTFLENKKLYR
jgi:hypothetical protein